jgi:hypothetical protein
MSSVLFLLFLCFVVYVEWNEMMNLQTPAAQTRTDAIPNLITRHSVLVTWQTARPRLFRHLPA